MPAVIYQAIKKLKSYFMALRGIDGYGAVCTSKTCIEAVCAICQDKTGDLRMAGEVNKLLGDTVARTVVKLLVVSLLVGFLMAIFGLTPWNIIYGARDFVVDLWRSGFHALGAIGDYLILGATIVIPVFIILRLLSYRR
ncbi:hypothetical protein AT6N2_C2058 [Agrobacterium tumefaciens]|nr:hypothetical protein AT6N2_C2058 [Agrobacterium tumefaciens]